MRERRVTLSGWAKALRRSGGNVRQETISYESGDK